MNDFLISKEHEKSLIYQNLISKSGYIIGLDQHTLNIKFVSENISDIIDSKYKPNEIIGLKLEYIFPFDIDFESFNLSSPEEFEKKFVICNEKKYFLIYYLYNGFYYIEMEEYLSSGSQFYVDKFTDRIILSKTKDNIWQNLVGAVKKITNYNKAIILKFGGDYSLKCIAENKDVSDEAFLNLESKKKLINPADFVHLKRKRNSYVSSHEQSTVKLISENDEKINLSFSEFSPSSDEYLEYLRTFDVQSFFSIPIIVNQKLWGILVCANSTPKAISLKQRSQCVRLARLARVSFVNLKYDKKNKFKIRLNLLLNSIKENLLIENGYDKIYENLPDMLNFTRADGIAFVNQNIISTYRIVPENDEILTIKKWAFKEKLTETLFLDSFYTNNNLALNLSTKSYGISFKILDFTQNIFIIWFKSHAESPNKNNQLDINDSFLNNYSTSTQKIILSRKINLTKSEKWKTKEVQVINDIVQLFLKTIHKKSFKIAELNHQIKEVNYELDSFSNSISHDLRTPMAVMRLNCQLLQRSLESQNLKFDRIDNVISEIDNVTEMMQDILNLSKAKNSILNLEEIDCAKLLDKIIKESIIYNEINHIEIELGMLHPVYCDKTMAYEIFSNMINNAIKYTSNTTSPKLEISSAILNNQVIYKFKDNGIGIKESDREKMFKLFSRMSNSSGFKGTGVGLSIVHRMMERLEGSIDYTSEENIGTEFILKFNMP